MIDSINAANNRISRKALGQGGSDVDEPSFSDRLKTMLKDVNNKQHKADADAQKVIRGELGIHEGMLSLSEADISLRYMIQVRSKVMQAYNEIIKMSL